MSQKEEAEDLMKLDKHFKDLQKVFSPTELTINGQKLKFVEDIENQRCRNCWFHWFDQEMCHSTPCNSQCRTDGKVGHWEEEQ